MTLYQRIGGAATVQAIARDFYTMIDEDPQFAAVRAYHQAGVESVIPAFAAWFAAWLGGPPMSRDEDAAHAGRGCLMSRHRAMHFGLEPARDWLGAMNIALVRHVRDDGARDTIYGGFLRMAAVMVDMPTAEPAEAAEPADQR